MSDDFVDLVLTSPPYDNLRTYDGYSFDFESIAKSMYKILKSDGILVWVVGDATIKGSETGSSFKQALYFISLGLKLHDTMIYEKNSPAYPASSKSNRYTQIFEYMSVFAKGQVPHQLIIDKPNKWAGHKDFSGKLKNPVPDFSPRNNIWKYTTSFNGVKHPAPFPEALATDHVLSWSSVGSLVYDPFMGSGTTAVAAIKNQRDYIGSEMSADYVALANQRIERLS
jgi:site-specific DNA-methyltransferase (adenine-specific)